MMSGKRILNVDEANLNQGAFIRNGWGVSAKAMRHVTKPLGYRLTLTAGVDTDGRAYFAVSQQGNESRLFGIFLHRLVSCLDAEDPDWRDNTILLLDGCSYHRSDETCEAFTALQIPVMISGPYGYDGSPCEKLFALLKVGDLNPANLKTGKR